MPQEEHAVPDHNSYQAEVAVLVDGLDTICGTCQEGACGPEECLELVGMTEVAGLTELAGMPEGAVLMEMDL